MEDVVSPPGDHKNVPPPVEGVPVRVAETPEHTVDELTVTAGATGPPIVMLAVAAGIHVKLSFTVIV
jgi:hypothetical protein